MSGFLKIPEQPFLLSLSPPTIKRNKWFVPPSQAKREKVSLQFSVACFHMLL